MKGSRKTTFLLTHNRKTKGGTSLGKAAKQGEIQSSVYGHVNFELGSSYLEFRGMLEYYSRRESIILEVEIQVEVEAIRVTVFAFPVFSCLVYFL